MDNLAHTLAGAALAESGLKRRTGLGMATLLIAANLPDIDVVVLLFADGLPFRRGWTHGVLALFVLPIILTGAMMLWARRRHGKWTPSRMAVRPGQVLLLSCVGVLSHPALDWLNTYGMRWLMPFDGTWFYGDALFIVDPWLWGILLVGVLAGRRVGGRAAVAAVAVALLYISGMTAASLVGRRMVAEGMRDEGYSPSEVMVGPVALNPNLRHVVIREGDRYLTGTLNWLPHPRLRISEVAVHTNAAHPAALVASGTEEARGFLTWARFPFYTIRPQGDGFSVILDDMRYASPGSPSWAAVRVNVAGPDTRRAGTTSRSGETVVMGPS
jgi:inner membrane protein